MLKRDGAKFQIKETKIVKNKNKKNDKTIKTITMRIKIQKIAIQAVLV